MGPKNENENARPLGNSDTKNFFEGNYRIGTVYTWLGLTFDIWWQITCVDKTLAASCLSSEVLQIKDCARHAAVRDKSLPDH